MSFARGFQTGLSAVQQFKDLRDERLQREQLAELEARRQAQIDAQQAQAGLEQQAIQQGTPLASAVPVDPMRAQLGLGAEPVGQMSPVIPQQTQLGGQPVAMRFQQSADQLPTMSEQDYLREQARIYSSFGDNATAAGLRAEALGYETRALADERYKAERAEDIRRFGLELEQDKIRAQASKDQAEAAKNNAAAQIARTNQQVEAFKNDRLTNQATLRGESIYRDVMINGGTYQQAMDEINKAFPEDNIQYQAAVTALQNAALKGAGMSETKVGQLYNRMVKPVEAAISRKYDSTDAQLKAFNKSLSQYVDSNKFDGVSASIVLDEETGMYNIVEGDQVTGSFNSLDEIAKKAEEEIGNIKNNPIQFAMDYNERAAQALQARLRGIEDLTEREKDYREFLSKNPELIGSDRLRDVEKAFGIGGKPDVTGLGDRDSKPKDKPTSFGAGLGARQKEEAKSTAEQEKERQAKIDYYSDVTPGLVQQANQEELEELYANRDFLPENVQKLVGDRLASVGLTNLRSF